MAAVTESPVEVPSNDWINIGPAPLTVQKVGTVYARLVAGGNKPGSPGAGHVIDTLDPWTLTEQATNVWVRASSNTSTVVVTRF